MNLEARQMDRAVGSIVGGAIGDALGAQYEFGPEHPDEFVPQFGKGHFGHGVGEWTDDTEMSIPILRQAAGELGAGTSVLEPAGQTAILKEWITWSHSAKDVGNQTRAVLRAIEAQMAHAEGAVLNEIALQASERQHEHAGKSAGNGSLMRTGPIGLIGIALSASSEPARSESASNEPASEKTALAAGQIAQLTHWESDNVDACVLWSLAIEHAILTGEIDVRRGLHFVPEGQRRERWSGYINEAVAPDAHPRDFMNGNGWVVQAFRAALSAVAGAVSFDDAVYRAIRGGGDTDTVAAIAGNLAGAKFGLSGIPLSLQLPVHGYPGLDVNALVRLAALAVRGGKPDKQGWPSATSMFNPSWRRTEPVQHPFDAGVWLGSQSSLSHLPESVGAVVSLSRLGTKEIPAGIQSVRVWLIDTAGENNNLDFTLAEAADVIALLRRQGKQVFVHCAEARSRTSAVAALYAVRHRGASVSEAWSSLNGRNGRGALPHYDPAPFLREAVERIVTSATR